MEVKPEQVEETQQQPEQGEEIQEPELRRKLFVLNLPWSFKVEDIKKLFGECGTVANVEVISPSQPLPSHMCTNVFECTIVDDLEMPKLKWDKKRKRKRKMCCAKI